MKKCLLILLLMVGGVSAPIEALTVLELEAAFDFTSNVAFWQNVVLAIVGSKMHQQGSPSSVTTTNYRDPAVVLGNTLQLPRDIIGAALESNKNFVDQMVQALAIAKLADDKVMPSVIMAFFDTLVFNEVNRTMLLRYRAAELQIVRRLARIITMAVVRYCVLLFVQGVINSTRCSGDTSQSMLHKDVLCSQAALCFYSKTLYHIFTECAGAVIAGMLDKAAVEGEQVIVEGLTGDAVEEPR